VASAVAAQVLDLLLAGQLVVPGGPRPLVHDWLARCTASGHRPPDRLLPGVLAAATADPHLRDSTITAGGARAAWLAGRNPQWAWAAAAAADDVADASTWRTGSREARFGLLAARRADQAERARALLESTWSDESAKDRAAIVRALATGLGPADEPFLERALDDRSRPVRLAAAELLAGLPDSQFAARMAARTRRLVRVHGQRRRRLEVTLPDDLDEATRRDGVVDSGAPPKTGRRSWRLIQLVAAAPLSTWESDGLDPEAFAHLVDQPGLLSGLVRATRRQRDTRWAAALLAVHAVPDLLPFLDAAALANAAPAMIASAADGQVVAVLDVLPPPWSAATSAAALERLQPVKAVPVVQAALPILAERLDPATRSSVEDWIEGLQRVHHLRRHLRGLAHALAIRSTIAEELA
jgi:hypothetical protein